MKTTEKLTLADVKEQFEHWRKTKQHRSPIPEELWNAATSLAGKHSPHEISKALNLTYAKLKKRIALSSSSQTSPSPDFVKLGVVHPPVTPSSCVLEVSDKHGASMKVSMTGAPCLDVLELVQAFWVRNS
jgi:hypothetical protein